MIRVTIEIDCEDSHCKASFSDTDETVGADRLATLLNYSLNAVKAHVCFTDCDFMGELCDELDSYYTADFSLLTRDNG